MRRMDRETRYKEWMEKVTQNAVDRALQFHSTFQRTKSLQTGSNDFGPPSSLPRSVSFNGLQLSSRNSGQPKNWSLEVNSADRRNTAANIYALLLQWKPDNSGQWASRVAATVPIFEEALYQKSNSIEEYKSIALLDVHLRQILRQFENGDGLIFFHKQLSETCPAVGRSEDCGRLQAAKAKSVRTQKNRSDNFDKIKHIRDWTTENKTAADEDKLQTYPDSALPKVDGHPSRQDLGLNEREADKADKLVVKKQGLQKGLGETLREKTKVLSSEIREASEGEKEASEDEKVLGEDHEDPQNVSKERSTNAEPNNGSERELGSPCTRMSAFVDEGVSSDESSSAEDSPYASRMDLRTYPISLRWAMPFNQKTNITKGDAEFHGNLKVVNDLETQQTQLFLKPSAVTSETLDNLSTCSVMPVTQKKDLRDPESSRFAEVNNPPLPSEIAFDKTISESSPDRNNLGEIRISQHQKYQDLISLRSLFQLDDDEALASCHQPLLPTIPLDPCDLQGDRSRASRMPIESPAADNSRDRQQRNTEQVAHIEGNTHSGSSVIENAVFRMQNDSIRVSLLSLLREGDTIDGRVSLMSLLRERDDYEVVIFDHDMLASINSNGDSHTDDPNESSEVHAICCVCMVGPRGAAFVPCGHTFCRKCAYELQMSRGACPLCNKSIKRILKLY
ncbi:hypothetical protein O6H91_17G024100 [Diphasiastrum complanatum]|uniref:Uncharacterized protein n=2 Tax=Diphasiastrum complanatum TaxID=34168 RepID=A0ACC2B4W8_DIPCM|nr:hypothetical protein O6H91_17G024100 [Diphasiastrum complanatum]KAJ7524834.1 hypothetical protein O6H91_17G024100 [Diphasiastrum complanatum]